MFKSFASALSPIVEEFRGFEIGNTFALEKIKDFPFVEFQNNAIRYVESMRWFTGEALDPEDRAKVDNYPVRINPISGTCLKHAYALFGEVQDDGRPMVVPKLITETRNKEERKASREAAHVAETVLNRMWWESFGRTLMMRNAITSQIFGGSVFHLRYVPEQKYREVPLQIERVSPECFVGIPMSGDEYRLQESWIVKRISHQDARRYGVTINSNIQPYWIEQWTLDKYLIRINDQPVNYSKDGKDFTSEGTNTYGFIPSVYIPHIRVTGFYGENTFKNLTGIVKEMNFRYGDLGDAYNADTHAYVAMRNVQGTVGTVKIGPGLTAVDLGSSDGLSSGDGHKPDMFEIRKPSVTQPMIAYMEKLENQYRRDANHPAVADGEDEGSQRSAATLVTRMWPLVSHINTERIHWTCGLDWLSSMALRILAMTGNNEITKDHIVMRIRQSWAPILPKDREVFINELVARAANNMGSPQHLIEMTGDVEDVEEEIERMLEWKRQQSEIQSAARQQETQFQGKVATSAAKLQTGRPGGGQGTAGKKESASPKRTLSAKPNQRLKTA